MVFPGEGNARIKEQRTRPVRGTARMEKGSMNYSGEPQRFLSGTEIWSLQQGAGAGDGLKRLPDADLEPGPGSLGSNG